MRFFQILIWVVLLYFLYKAVKYIFLNSGSRPGRSEPRVRQTQRNQRNKVNIDRSDIVDAEFEEIEESEDKEKDDD